MTDRSAASVGFVLAGVAVAAGLAGWPGGLGLVAAALAGGSLVAFAGRRYGRLDRGPADVAAGAGGLLVAVTAVVSVVRPAVGGGIAALALAPALAVAAGLGVVAMARLDADGVPLSRLVAMVRRTLTGTALGLSGLVAIVAWSVVVGGVYRAVTGGGIDPAEGAVLSSLALGLGTGSVAWLYLQATDRGLDFIDVRLPGLRDAAVVVAGILVLLGVNVAIASVFQSLGLESAQHGLYDVARETPELLLLLIPLSLLVIGPGEELLYRNVVQKSLYGPFSRPGAIVVASAIFAAAHIPAYSSPGSSVLALLNTLTVIFALSLVLGVAFDRTRNLAVPALIHGTFNAIAFAATYVELAG